MRLRRAPVLKGAAVVGLLMLGGSFAPAAEARMRCSYSGAPENLLSVAADRDALGEIIRRGDEIVVREFLERPSRCLGGVPTVLNTDTIRLFPREPLDFIDVLLGGGPFAPGATPETEGASEIEIEFSGRVEFGTVVGTPRADEFHWNLEGTRTGLNLNPGIAGDQDVDVTVPRAGPFGKVLVANGAAGNDRIIPATGAVFSGYVYSQGGRGDDFLIAPRRTAGILQGGRGNDVLVGGSSALLIDLLAGGAGNDRLAGAGGDDAILGGRGRDLIVGGPGRDGINSRDSHRDRVRCGAGRDRVMADRQDRLRGCEVVRRR